MNAQRQQGESSAHAAHVREAIDTLMEEAYEGPPDPNTTWFATNAHESGLLGSLKHLTPEQAWHRPPGVSHSVAEHVGHLIYSLDVALRRARGEHPADEWDKSWDVGPLDEQQWQSMQRSLRENHLRLRMWAHTDEAFDRQESVTGFISTIAHAAYHLGAIRTLAALARAG